MGRRRVMGPLTQKNRPTLPLAIASDRSLSSASPSSRAPHESPCLAMAGAGSSTTIHRLLPIRSARPRERFSDLLTMIGGTTNLNGAALPEFLGPESWPLGAAVQHNHGFTWNHVWRIAPTMWCASRATKVPPAWPSRPRWPTAADLPSRVRRSTAVSYTHLTLPTILLV